MKEPFITVGQDILQLIAEIDEFKGQWQAFVTSHSISTPPSRPI